MKRSPRTSPPACGRLDSDLLIGPAAADPFAAPGWREITWIAPGRLFAALAEEPNVAFLDSGGAIEPRSRWSWLAVRPFRALIDAPWPALAAALAECRGRTGCAIGFIGYETATGWHTAPTHSRPSGQPDSTVFFYDTVFAFDRLEHRAWACGEGERLRARAQASAPGRRKVGLAWRHETPRAVHEARIRRAIDYIEAGDIYQANITARARAARPDGLRASDIHLALRAASPAPFGAFLDCGPALAVASASPERLVSLEANGAIEARPIKGTAPRGADALQDAALARALLASGKDRAENLMIVDLLRHDIGRVAEIGSVRVPALCTLESFAQVHHLVSVVQGRLRDDATAVDLLRVLSPGGSVTGAPKQRAMQVIAELEQCARGPYCGAMVRFDFDGGMDSSILIRTLAIREDEVAAHAGGGIVAESDPAAEWAEMMLKLRPLLVTLG